MKALEEQVKLRLSEGEQVERIKWLKNNGLELDGFSFKAEGQKLQPTVYANEFFYGVISPEEIERIAEKLVSLRRECRLIRNESVEEILNYQKAKDNVHYRLVSSEQNQELLRRAPWLPWLDLAIMFHIRIPDSVVPNATALIHTGLMEHWGISIRELFMDAERNMGAEYVIFKPIEELEADLEVRSGMWVLSYRQLMYGAAAIVDLGVLKWCRQQLGEDFWVIPSSVHETIVVPQNCGATRNQLDQMLQEINAAKVRPEERLGEHVYFFNSEQGKLVY